MKKFFLLLVILFFLVPKHASAEVIHSFDTSINAQKNGLMEVTETINYDFEYGERHGIYRFIPTFTKVGNLYRIIKVSNIKVERDGQKEDFSKSQTDEQISFKIGSANKTITGVHTYKIFYTVENGIGSNFEDHDEIYWNATGNGWDVNIEKANAKITTDFPAKLNDFICFEGPQGSKDKSCRVSSNLVGSSQILYPGYGLTIVALYPFGTFPRSILSNSPPKSFFEKIFSYILSNYNYIWIFLNLLISPVLIFWYGKHKNKKRFGPPYVNFEIPNDEKSQRLPPALAGTIDTATLERNDVTATIFDLAIRKYIKLEQSKIVKKLSPDVIEQKIIKLKNPDEKLSSFEKTLINRLFRDGDSVNLSDLKLDFYKTYSDIEDSVFSELIKKGYYIKNPKIQKGILLFLSIAALISFNILLAIVIFFLSVKLNGRTVLGDEIDFKIDGLKLFLQKMDRNYNWQAEKFYTVEQMIPYAMALGYIDKFMDQLKIIKPDYNPGWYSGYSGSFYGSYSGFYSSVSSNMVSSSASGSSGGSSGGGGGGGGGGSW